MVRHVRAVGPAVPYWDLVPVTTPTPTPYYCPPQYGDKENYRMSIHSSCLQVLDTTGISIQASLTANDGEESSFIAARRTGMMRASRTRMFFKKFGFNGCLPFSANYFHLDFESQVANRQSLVSYKQLFFLILNGQLPPHAYMPDPSSLSRNLRNRRNVLNQVAGNSYLDLASMPKPISS